MGSLSGFLKQNAVQKVNEKLIVSERFLDENSKPMEWEVCTITSEEDERLRKDCTKRVPIPGKKNQYTAETDYNLYLGKLAAKCTVFPNLNDKELQDSYGTMGSDAVLKAMLTPGEYAEYLSQVQRINDFDITMEEAVDEAKN
ncbi:MAG: phage portal protein [Clostridiaceae bacterium]|nr:phage portal protein [Clostridiaceae bacterium]